VKRSHGRGVNSSLQYLNDDEYDTNERTIDIDKLLPPYRPSIANNSSVDPLSQPQVCVCVCVCVCVFWNIFV
jgi:hypothetical protein